MGFWFIEHPIPWILNNSANPLLTDVSGGFVVCRLPTTHLSFQGIAMFRSVQGISALDKHFLDHRLLYRLSLSCVMIAIVW